MLMRRCDRTDRYVMTSQSTGRAGRLPLGRANAGMRMEVVGRDGRGTSYPRCHARLSAGPVPMRPGGVSCPQHVLEPFSERDAPGPRTPRVEMPTQRNVRRSSPQKTATTRAGVNRLGHLPRLSPTAICAKSELHVSRPRSRSARSAYGAACLPTNAVSSCATSRVGTALAAGTRSSSPFPTNRSTSVRRAALRGTLSNRCERNDQRDPFKSRASRPFHRRSTRALWNHLAD